VTAQGSHPMFQISNEFLFPLKIKFTIDYVQSVTAGNLNLQLTKSSNLICRGVAFIIFYTTKLTLDA
jgi:hypothetical protein